MNRSASGLFLGALIMVAFGCATQKPPQQNGQTSGRKKVISVNPARITFLKQPPQFNDEELEVVRRTREPISHYFANPNDIYISGVTLGMSTIGVYVTPLRSLQKNYHIEYECDGKESGEYLTEADDSFRPIYFEFNRNYELQKCVNNWGKECKPIW